VSKPKRDAWMPLYTGDYLRDTARLSTEQHGAYLLLIMDYWVNGPLPDDDAALGTIARMAPAAWKRMRRVLESFFQVRDGHWIHKRIDRERTRAFAIRELRSIAGKESAERKANKRAALVATGDGVLLQQNATQSQPPRIPSTQSGSARAVGAQPLSNAALAMIKASLERATQ